MKRERAEQYIHLNSRVHSVYSQDSCTRKAEWDRVGGIERDEEEGGEKKTDASPGQKEECYIMDL